MYLILIDSLIKVCERGTNSQSIFDACANYVLEFEKVLKSTKALINQLENDKV